MAKNDTVVIDSIIQQRMGLADLTPEEKGEAFQRLAVEQVLKHMRPEPEELEEGIVDGSYDGGVDGLFIAVNGLLMADVESMPPLGSRVELEIWILTCKHHNTFRQAPLDNLYASVVEILDLSLSREDLKGQYSDELLRRRFDLYYAYERAAHATSSLAINVAYISRGETANIGNPIVARAIVKSGVRKVGHAAALLSSLTSMPSLNLTPSMTFASWRKPRSRRQDCSALMPIL